MFPEAAARAAGKQPVLALMPVPGEVDVVIASELMEAGRAVQRGLVTPDRTTLIASTHRVYSMTERTAIGDGRADAAAFITAGQTSARVFVRADFARIAEDAGSVISVLLFGAVAAAGVLPFAREDYENAIRRGGVGVDASLAAFGAGYAAAAAVPASDPARTPTTAGAPAHLPAPSPVAQAPAGQVAGGPKVAALLARITGNFPPASQFILQTAAVRLTDYQDERYAADYLSRLETVRDLDVKYGPGDFRVLCEAGRQLALWMSTRMPSASLTSRSAVPDSDAFTKSLGPGRRRSSRSTSFCILESKRSPTSCRRDRPLAAGLYLRSRAARSPDSQGACRPNHIGNRISAAIRPGWFTAHAAPVAAVPRDPEQDRRVAGAAEPSDA